METPDDMQERWSKAIREAGVFTEQELRGADVPWLKSPEELSAYIASLVDRPHDYGTCVYAMSLAATAAFQYVAGRLGVTGFQASCADLDILRRTRRYKGPFAVIDANDMLYPQYDIPGKVREMLTKWQPWAAQEATKLLENDSAHPAVREHWQALAAQAVHNENGPTR